MQHVTEDAGEVHVVDQSESAFSVGGAAYGAQRVEDEGVVATAIPGNRRGEVGGGGGEVAEGEGAVKVGRNFEAEPGVG